MSVTSTWVAFRRSVSADFRDSSVIDVCAMVVVVVANRLSKMEGARWGGNPGAAAADDRWGPLMVCALVSK